MALNKPSFPNLTPDDISLICRYGTRKTYPKHSVLINEGDCNGAFYIILSGKVKVYTSDSAGKEFTLSIQGPGEYFGELAIFDEAPRSASVITLETSCLSVIARTVLRDCLAQHPKLTIKMIHSLCERIRSLTETVKNLALCDVYDRVIRTLERIAIWQDGKGFIEERLTHQELANRVGSSREMISRIMKNLTASGRLQIQDKKFIIYKTKLHPSTTNYGQHFSLNA